MEARLVTGVLPESKARALFFLCWFAYFSANLGRLAYTVALVELVRAEGYTNAAAGLVSTGFFVCYGVCQLFSGYLGDRISPRLMVGVGLLGTAILNGCMTLSHSSTQMLWIWCLNGVFQSILWPPIVRIVAEYYPPERRQPVLVGLSTTYPLATLFAYACGAGLVWLWGWRSVFWVFAGVTLGAGLVWVVLFRKLSNGYSITQSNTKRLCAPAEQQVLHNRPLPLLPIALFCIALVAQGFLRDGLMNWVPAYLENTFALGVSVSIVITTLLPVVNLAGVYGTNFLHRLTKNEAQTSLTLFAISATAAAALWLLGENMIVAVSCFAVITACMMGTNLMLVSFVPAHFARWGKAALVSGTMNSMVYIGSSLATYGIGSVADRFGWNAMLILLLAMALMGTVFCLLGLGPWKRVAVENSGEESL